jgi:hypothetical protein
VNYGQYLLLPLFILALLFVPEAVLKVLSLILLAILLEVVTLFQANLKPLKDLFDQRQETVRNTTLPSSSLQVASISNESTMVAIKTAIYLSAANPESCLWQEWDLSRFDLTAFFSWR